MIRKAAVSPRERLPQRAKVALHCRPAALAHAIRRRSARMQESFADEASLLSSTGDFSSGTGLWPGQGMQIVSKKALSWRASRGMTSIESCSRRVAGRRLLLCATNSSGLPGPKGAAQPTCRSRRADSSHEAPERIVGSNSDGPCASAPAMKTFVHPDTQSRLHALYVVARVFHSVELTMLKRVLRLVCPIDFRKAMLEPGDGRSRALNESGDVLYQNHSGQERLRSDMNARSDFIFGSFVPRLPVFVHCAAFEKGWHGGPPAKIPSWRTLKPMSRGLNVSANLEISNGCRKRRFGRLAASVALAVGSFSMQQGCGNRQTQGRDLAAGARKSRKRRHTLPTRRHGVVARDTFTPHSLMEEFH